MGRRTRRRLPRLIRDKGPPHSSEQTFPRGVERATTTEKISQPYRFADGFQDPTGLYHFSARYYDPNIGRFTSPDPSGREKNPYLYAEGDPVNRIDPDGTLSFGPALDALSLGNDAATVGKAWNAALDGDFGRAAGITFGLAFGKAVVGTCIGVAGALTGGTGAAVAAVPCMVAGEYAGSFAEERTVEAWP
ncbi:RHS repeat-associated core domain-containing protein [Streptomyces sp. NPDC086081]|uniref:RHS repeat-associated core domain-containing protein n=1 Tax=Streptomyces sp. NPDC086081 TaxID=3365749 RepID=UPI00380837C9